MIELTTPVGRIVSGHPMKYHPKKDDNNQPVLRDGVAVKEAFFALAIPKAGETHWNQTSWGSLIYNEALQAWPNGETGMPVFSWKITDGDSTIPNRKMKRPVDKEGYPGHWVISFSTELPISCFHPAVNGQFPQMQNDTEIKCGDYVQVNCTFRDNKPKNGIVKTPGMYSNPKMVLLVAPGVAIVGEGAGDPNAAFAQVGQLPAGAQVDYSTPAQPAPVVQAFAPPPQPQVQPVPSFVNGPTPTPPAPPASEPVLSNGYTASQLKAAGWTDAQIATVS